MRRLHLLAAALLAAGLTAAEAPAQTSAETVEADFLPKFPRYVQWPAASRPGEGQPYQLCVIGEDPFGPMLDRAAADERIAGRGVAVRRLAAEESPAGCHFAFVRGTDAEATGRLLAALRDHAILTITDRPGGARGMIHFVVADGRVRFLIDDAAAAERGLSISSRLLALALGVRQRRS